MGSPNSFPPKVVPPEHRNMSSMIKETNQRTKVEFYFCIHLPPTTVHISEGNFGPEKEAFLSAGRSGCGLACSRILGGWAAAGTIF